jgi:hypothetical protein
MRIYELAIRVIRIYLRISFKTMKKKTVTKVIWIFLSTMIIFTMVLWTVGVAFI